MVGYRFSFDTNLFDEIFNRRRIVVDYLLKLRGEISTTMRMIENELLRESLVGFDRTKHWMRLPFSVGTK